MSRNILVTGGAGYIGSHACKELARRGYLPVVFDNLRRGHPASVKWGPLAVGNLTSKSELCDVMRKFNIEAVIHFAALAYVEESVRHPGQYFQNNIAGTLNLLEAMAELGIRNLVFSSSCAVYGIPDVVPIPEDAPARPINPYGESKLQAERMMSWFGKAFGLNWVALRYFNAAGADPDGEIGEDHDPETHLIPLAMRAALRRGPPLRIYGTDYATEDGTAIRDFVHVCDLAEAHVLALEYLQKSGASGAFNLGTGRGHSIRDVVREIENCTGVSVPFVESGRRPGDPPQLVGDARRAKETLGWTPKLSDLHTIVRTALNWEHREGLQQVAE